MLYKSSLKTFTFFSLNILYLLKDPFLFLNFAIRKFLEVMNFVGFLYIIEKILIRSFYKKI